ncbi:MAG: hypothetical protein OXG15_06515 [Gammaproteobacteria bacterium]|nr:hypothetical protein [Gammaproteobacteria bacterium]
MIPLGFFSVCLRAPHLEETVSFYKALGFSPVGEDAPGLRTSLEYRSQSLTFMSFLQDNLVNFRGAHIHQLKECMKEIGIPVTLFEEFKSEERLMLDDLGNPLPDNECGSFSIGDPDGHEFFFNTHREERAPFEEAVLSAPADFVGTPFAEQNRPGLTYSLEVTDLPVSQRFYESIGLVVTTQGDIAWVYPSSDVGNTRFIFQLRQGLEKRVRIGLSNSQSSIQTLQELGFERENRSRETWHGQDPDGRWLELER